MNHEISTTNFLLRILYITRIEVYAKTTYHVFVKSQTVFNIAFIASMFYVITVRMCYDYKT